MTPVLRSARVPTPGAVLMLLARLGMQGLMRDAAIQAMNQPQPQWLTLREASEHSGLSVAFLRRMISSGKLRAVKDRAIKIRRVDLDNLDSLPQMAETSRKLASNVEELRADLKRRRG